MKIVNFVNTLNGSEVERAFEISFHEKPEVKTRAPQWTETTKIHWYFVRSMANRACRRSERDREWAALSQSENHWTFNCDCRIQISTYAASLNENFNLKTMIYSLDGFNVYNSCNIQPFTERKVFRRLRRHGKLLKSEKSSSGFSCLHKDVEQKLSPIFHPLDLWRSAENFPST